MDTLTAAFLSGVIFAIIALVVGNLISEHLSQRVKDSRARKNLLQALRAEIEANIRFRARSQWQPLSTRVYDSSVSLGMQGLENDLKALLDTLYSSISYRNQLLVHYINPQSSVSAGIRHDENKQIRQVIQGLDPEIESLSQQALKMINNMLNR